MSAKPSTSNHPSLAARLKLGSVRAGFALGSRLAPKRTVNRAARLFATPFASGRSRAQAEQGDAEMRRNPVGQPGNRRHHSAGQRRGPHRSGKAAATEVDVRQRQPGEENQAEQRVARV